MADFKISRVRYTWHGDWVANHEYNRDDVVRYGGSSFVCIRGHQSNADFYIDVNYTVPGTNPPVPAPAWESMTEGTAWRGNWTTGVHYNVGDVILAGGVLYLCTVPHNSTVLFDNISNWTPTLVGANWTGDFVSYKRYYPGDLVRWEGTVYRCETENTSGQYFESGNVINWSVHYSGDDYFNEWAPTTRYHVNDLVKWGGSIWRCNTAHTSVSTFDQIRFTMELPGYQFGEDWNIGTLYQQGDIVRHGGNTYFSLTLNQSIEPNNPINGDVNWKLLAEAYRLLGDWDENTTYLPGDVVRRGGELFVSKNKAEPDGSSLDYLDDSVWTKLIPGSERQGVWVSAVWYRVGDVVFYEGGAYRCIQQHYSDTQNFPGDNGNGIAYWEIYTQAGPHTSIMYKGDIPMYNLSRLPSGDGSTLNTTRLPIGDEDELMMVNNSSSPSYKKFGEVVQLRYVAPSGVDRADYGLHPFTPWKTLRYALTQIDETLSGNVKVELKTGTYTEILPMVIPANVSVIGDEVRGVTIQPNDPVANLSQDSTYTKLVLSRMSDIIELTVKGDTVSTSAILEHSQDKTQLGSPAAALQVQLMIVDVKNFITYHIEGTGSEPAVTGTNTATTNAGVLSTIQCLINNTEFIADEAIAYMQVYYPENIFDTESCKRDVREFLKAFQYDLLYPGNYKSLNAARYYKNAVMGSAGENMFLMRDASSLRNCTLKGLVGTLAPAEAYDLLQRPTGGAYVSLDPGWGPNDSRTWITTRSPYVQNCSTYGYGAVGAKMDGTLHAGGLKSMVCNDFTQMISDGIGAWAIDDGKMELVSIFTYYSHIGYLTEGGGKIRATNGNNSYGNYGAVSNGTDVAEVPKYGLVNNRNQEAVVASAFAGESSDTIYALEYSHAGAGYTNATYSITGSGTFASLLQDDFRDDAISQSRIIANTPNTTNAGGGGYIRQEGNAQSGDRYQIRLAAVDGNTFATYNGVRLIITSGTGTGQYGNIIAYNNSTKAALIAKESFAMITATETSSTNNLITVPSTVNLNPGTPIYFTGVAIGGLSINTLYYVLSANFSGTKFAVSTSLNGSAVALSNVTASTMNVYAAGWDHIVPGTAISDPLDTTSRYKIEPKVVFASPGFNASSAIIDASTYTWSDVVYGNTTESYTGLVATPGTGQTIAPIVPVNASFNITKTGLTYSASLVSGGAGYNVGDVITIAGNQLGGTTPGNDCYITVSTTTDDSTDAILTFTTSGTATGGKWVTVSYNNTVGKWTEDGQSWTSVTLPMGAQNWSAVAAGNNKFVAISYNSTQAAYSLDGKTWIGDNGAPLPAAIALPSAAGWSSVEFGNGRFVAVAKNSNSTAYTVDGITWTSGGTMPSTRNWTDVIYGQNKWVAVSGATTIDSTRIVDTAGVIAYVTPNFAPTVGATVTVSGTLTGTGTITGYSTPTTYYVTAVASSVTLGNVLLAGNGGQFTCNSTTLTVGDLMIVSGNNSGLGQISGYSNSTTYVISATNGSTTFTLTTQDGSPITTITAAGNTLTGLTFVQAATMTLSATSGGEAVTTTAGTTTGLTFNLGSSAGAYSSNNGATWTSMTLPATANWSSVAYGNNRFVAISKERNLCAYSLNGTSWTLGYLPTTDGQTQLEWNKVRYAQGLFFAVATGFNGVTTTVAATTQFGLMWNLQTMPSSQAWSSLAFGNPSSTGKWVAVASSTGTSAVVQTGAKAIGRAVVVSGVVGDIRLLDPGSGYTTSTIPATSMVAGGSYTIVSLGNTIFTNYGAAVDAVGTVFYATGPAAGNGTVTANVTLTLVDPNKTTTALIYNRLGDGVLSQPTFLNRGNGYKTSSTIVTVSGNGYADIYPASDTITINGMEKYPRPGAQLTFVGNSQIYTVSIQTELGLTSNGYMSSFKVTPKFNINTGPVHGSTVEIREQYSQCRITGHDFLDVGTGNYVETNYPLLYAEGNYVYKAPENEITEELGGRVFYTSTDQDGNFRTGELFSVEQATGIVTLSAEYFNLGGLSELRLGGVRLGGSGVIIREFSTDASFTEDSNNVIPTQRAIKAYLQNRLSQGGQDIQTTMLNAGVTSFGPKTITTTTGIKENVAVVMNFTKTATGYMLAERMFVASFKRNEVIR